MPAAAAGLAYLLALGAALASPGPRPIGTRSVPPLTDGPMARPAMLRGPPPGAVVPDLRLPGRVNPPARHATRGWLSHRNPRGPGPLHVPEPPPPRTGPASINRAISDDDDFVPVADTRAFPYRAVVKLYVERSDGWYGCSGFVVQPDIVMTASHCIFDPDLRAFARDIVIIPAKSGAAEWFGRWDWEQAWARDEWHGTRAWEYDVGFIRVRGNLGAVTGQFGIAALDDGPILAAPLDTAGYPGTVPNSATPPNTMQRMVCRSHASGLGRLDIEHDCDTRRGQSGSPLWLRHGDDPYAVVGVHTHHSDVGPFTRGATRLSEAPYAWYAERTGLCQGACTYGSCRADTGERCTLEGACPVWRPGRCPDGYTCAGAACLCTEDRFEPDNTPDDAQVLRPGEIRRAMICPSGGDDLYRLDLAAGETATFRLTFGGDPHSLSATLIDAAGEVVGEVLTINDQWWLTFTAKADGRWHLRVFGVDGADAPYTIELSDTHGPPPVGAAP